MIALLIIYALVLIGFGAFISRRVKSAEDFLVARRNLGPGLLFTTLVAANIGAGSTVGAAGLGYAFGLSAWWWVGSAGIGSLLLAFTVGPKIWSLAKQFNFFTLGDYLEHRYDRRVRLIVAAILWVGTLALLSGQILAMGIILDAVAGVGKNAGCIIGGIVMILYFSAGGLLSSAWVNVIQLIVMLAGFIMAVAAAWHEAGSWAGITARLAGQFPTHEQTTRYLSFTGGGWLWIANYVVLLAPSFVVSPGLIQKIYGARDVRAARLGVAANAVCLLLFAFLPPLLGIMAHAQFPSLPHQEHALPMVMTKMLPEWLAGLALAAVLSAELSTCDAILFMLSTSLSIDWYKSYINPQADSDRLLRVNRLTALMAGIIGIGFALMLSTVIAALTIFYGLLVVSLAVPLIGGLYSAKPHTSSVLPAIIIAVMITLMAHILTRGQGAGGLSPQLIGIVVSLAVVAAGAFFQKHWRRHQ